MSKSVAGRPKDSVWLTRRMKQQLNLTLLCAQSASDPEPTFVGYAKGVLSLEWATPDACPRDPSDPVAGDGGSGGGGSGFWAFIKFVFWLCIIGLILYFVVGQSSSSGYTAGYSAENQAYSTTTSSTRPKGGTSYRIATSGASCPPYWATCSRMSLRGSGEEAAEEGTAVWDETHAYRIDVVMTVVHSILYLVMS